MTQDKKQAPNHGSKKVTPQTPVPQENKSQLAQKGGAIDLASINASGADASGEFVRDSGKNKRSVPEQKITTKKQTTKNPQEKEQTKKGDREGYVIPVLRTYHQDTKHIAQTKGGAELRTILAKEAEEKRKAQKEYIKNTKDIMKESAVLRDKYNNFTKKKQKSSKGAPDDPETQSINRESVNRTLSGAATYIQSVHNDATNKQNPPTTQPKPPTQDTKIKNTLKESNDKDVGKEGVFARVRGKVPSKSVLSKEKRKSLQHKQQEVIEKESIQNAWKDFKQKKKKLREAGLEARDVRSYTASNEPIPNKPLQKQNILLLIIVFFLLAGLIFFVIIIATSPAEKPVINSNTTNISSVSDVLNSEKKILVNISDSKTTPDAWKSITKKDGEQDTITKYVPYKLIGEKESQINFQEFSRAFNIHFPPGLQNAFGNYYFVGKYLTQEKANGIFIASVKKHGNAFVWTHSWEKSMINSFISVFPGFFQKSSMRNVSVTSRIIDNQDVRVIQNTLSKEKMSYYFLGDSILVIIAGDESIIPLINARIRSANTSVK